jgi:hypothetical protein
MAAGAGIDGGGLAVQDRTLVDGVHRFCQKPAGCPLDNDRTEWMIRITTCLPQRTLHKTLVPAALLADQLRSRNYVNAIEVGHLGLVF